MQALIGAITRLADDGMDKEEAVAVVMAIGREVSTDPDPQRTGGGDRAG
jgi:hypothetical protein